MDKYKNYTATIIKGDWCVTAGTEKEPKGGFIISKVPSHIKFPKAVATAIADSLNRNKTLQLVDLI